MRRIHIFLLLIALAAVIVAAVKLDIPSFFHPVPQEPEDPDQVGEGPEPDPEPAPDIRTASLTAVGDMFPHMPQITQAHLGGDNYDYSPCFQYLAPYFQASDFTTLNLETNQAGTEFGYGGATLGFNAPLQLSEALKEAGVDLYACATNHIFDRGLNGLRATLENVRSLGFITTGAYLSREERDTPVIVDINGIKVAFISYTDRSEVTIPKEHAYAVNYIPLFEDLSPVIADIKSARAAGADLVAVYPHWGDIRMYHTEPTEKMREDARKLAEAGADLIICGHAHVLNPMDWFYTVEEDGSRRATLVAYSLGNFFTNQQYLPHEGISTDLVEYGILLSVELSKDMNSGKAWISGVDYKVHWCHRNWRHRILVLQDVFENGPEQYNITAAQFERLKEKHQENVEILERYGFSEKMPDYMKESH
ncbi:MAG TPA: CapA family protein [Bacillota bacterium]|jgi:poly-gamma-glutamate synthesis protein (capsule biosynthesis protein)|nr:CapA family protein [Bacillota bacterium]HOJ83573.1 CapA family protein [Bacillota bacterium]HOL16911.1 CapA family protein [Bacillota bacterium]HPZ12320.1 CapA family protein [Bacillota bacterium]HQE10591.1 CapA family protein [Bacillota bacterium]